MYVEPFNPYAPLLPAAGPPVPGSPAPTDTGVSGEDVTLKGGVLPHDAHAFDKHRDHEDFGNFLSSLGRLIADGAMPDMDAGEGEGATKAVSTNKGLGRVRVTLSKAATNVAKDTDHHLVAVHNTTGAGIQAAHELGGIPAPSLAIIKPHHSFDGYGDISLVGTHHMVDPAHDSRNKIFGTDAYTPRQPMISHDVDHAEAAHFEKHIQSLAGQHRNFDGSSFSLNHHGIPAAGGRRAMIDRLKTDTHVRAAYLAHRGKPVAPVLRKVPLGYPDEKAVDGVETQVVLHRGMSKQDPEHFDRWLNEQTSRMYKPGYLRHKGKKLPYTAENITKAMTDHGTRNQERSVPYGLGQLHAHQAQPFGSLQEMKEHHESLCSQDADAHYTKTTHNHFERFQNRILPHHGSASDDSRPHDPAKMLADSARVLRTYASGPKTSDRMRSALAKHGFGAGHNDTTLKAGMDLAHRIKHAPTHYFEAKLNRTVHLGEFHGAVVPHGTHPHVIEALHNSGIHDIRHYDPQSETSRRKHVMALAQHPDAMIKSVRGIIGGFTGGFGGEVLNKAVRDVSSEARVPKGQKGAGRWRSDISNFNHDFKERKLTSSDQLEDLRSPDNHYLFAKIVKTETGKRKGVVIGRGMALVNDPSKDGHVLTTEKMDTVIDESISSGCKLPVFIYADANTAPHAPELYKFMPLHDDGSFPDLDQHGGLSPIMAGKKVSKAVRHESAGQTETNTATGKTIRGGQFAPETDAPAPAKPATKPAAKPAPTKAAQTAPTPLTAPQEQQVQAALTSGQAMIDKDGTKYTLKVRPAGSARAKTLGTFKTLREAKQNVLPALGVDGKTTKVTAYSDVGAKIGRAHGARPVLTEGKAEPKGYYVYQAGSKTWKPVKGQSEHIPGLTRDFFSTRNPNAYKEAQYELVDARSGVVMSAAKAPSGLQDAFMNQWGHLASDAIGAKLDRMEAANGNNPRYSESGTGVQKALSPFDTLTKGWSPFG